ncbi:MAG: carbohydrate ABC transporter substrate-binding protein [Hyphomicrobiales bacterium]
MTVPFAGLTWDHPRGFNALDKAGRDSGIITWDKQSLEGFESAPIADLCARYDLVVLDHPHLGEALDLGCLTALNEVFAPDVLARLDADSIGPSFRSYVMDGQLWALPLDAATQVMAVDASLKDVSLNSWASVLAFCQREGGHILSLAGPHAALSLMSIGAAIDPALDMADEGWLDNAVCSEAFDCLARLYMGSDPRGHSLNPIRILEALSAEPELRLCPLIYGYAPYAMRQEPNTVYFKNAPFHTSEGRPGSILGGTGIALSAKAKPTTALIEHLLWLMSPAVQETFIPGHDGQPSNRAAWQSEQVNAPTHGFYTATASSLEHAAIRPRHSGYIAFQTQASAFIRRALMDGENPNQVARTLQTMFIASLPSAKGTLQ